MSANRNSQCSRVMDDRTATSRMSGSDVMMNQWRTTRSWQRIFAERDLTEKLMFGGLAFLLAGHMTVAASGSGDLLVRVDPDQGEALWAADGVAPMVMRGRPMRGWLRVAPDVIECEETLDEWVARSVAYVKGTVNAPKA